MTLNRNETQLNIVVDQNDAVQQFEVVVAVVRNDIVQTNNVAGAGDQNDTVAHVDGASVGVQNDVVQQAEPATTANQNGVVQQSDSATTNMAEGQNAELIEPSGDDSNRVRGGEVLSLEGYARVAAQPFAAKRDWFVTEATRKSGVVYINSLALVELFMYAVTWVEHVQYNENLVNPLMRPMVSSGMSFMAKRWVATLQRYCECIALLMGSSNLPPRSFNFYRVISIGSSNSVWEKLMSSSVNEDVRIMVRRNSTDLGEPLGVVLSASTSVWLPISQRVFEFLMSERTRKDWDLQMNGETLYEVVCIPMAQARGNSIFVFRVGNNGGGDDNGDSLILQEIWNDATSSLLVYTTVDIPMMGLAMSGGDSSFVPILPSGFGIFPDGYNGGGDDGGNGAGLVLAVVVVEKDGVL
ncbi:Homeobox-leucine zipper protein ROC4 [Linum perenne]